MYTLENNVSWTTNLKNAFKHNVTRASIIYTDDNNQTVTINENNHLLDLKLEDNRYLPNIGIIGSAAARKLTINLQKSNANLNLENKVLTLKIGADYNNSTYYINYGNFIVDTPPENDETNGKIKIVAYDYMIKFDKPYINQLTYPCTLLQLLQNVCSQAGVTLETTNFANKNFSVTDNQFDGMTLREVLQNIAKCAFSWARIGQDNKLYLDFDLTSSAYETLTIDDYKTDGFKKANEYYGPVNQIVYADSDIEGQEERVKDQESIDENGLKELVIYDNLFAYTPEKRATLIQAGIRLLGLEYMPISQLESIGLIYLDCNDAIDIETLDEETYSSRVFNHTINYTGTTSDNIETEGTSLTEDTYKNTATNIFQNQQTKIMVDRANKKITSITQEIGDRSQKTTTITQDIDGIESKVEQMEDLTSTVTANKTVVLTDCLKGYILELQIKGNNSVFDYLYPEDDLYPSDTLYPKGDSRITVTNANNETFTYELRVDEVLRANEEVYDEYLLQDGNAKVIRRVNADGTTKSVEEVEDLGIYTIYLEEGNNTVSIKNYSAPISVTYVPRNEFTDYFATNAKMSSAITQSSQEIMMNVTETFESKEDAQTNYSQINQTAAEISSEVSRKVGNDEVISKINQSAEAVTIQAQKLNINGVISANGNFKVDTNGNMECTNAKMTGGQIELFGPKSSALFKVLTEARDLNYGMYIMPEGLEIRRGGTSNSISVFVGTPGYGSTNISLEDSGGFTSIGAIGITTPSVTQTSKAESKKNFEKLEDALKILKDVDVYKYNLKGEQDGTKKRIGFVIGDDFKYSKDLTTPDNDGVDAYTVASVCIKAIQEQQEEIKNLREEIKTLKGEKDG